MIAKANSIQRIAAAALCQQFSRDQIPSSTFFSWSNLKERFFRRPRVTMPDKKKIFGFLARFRISGRHWKLVYFTFMVFYCNAADARHNQQLLFVKAKAQWYNKCLMSQRSWVWTPWSAGLLLFLFYAIPVMSVIVSFKEVHLCWDAKS